LNRFRKAYQQSAIVLTRMTKFNTFVKQELSRLHADLRCCEARSRLDKAPSSDSLLMSVFYQLVQLGLVASVAWWAWNR